MGRYCPRVVAYAFKRQHLNPNAPIGDHWGMRVRANAATSPIRGSICLASPDLGGFWGGGGHIYIGEFVEHSPSRAAPWRRSIDDEWRSVLHSHSGRNRHGPLPPFHLQNVENTKAWYWIADGNSNTNEWSHSWAIRKLISSTDKTIIDGGSSEKRPFSLEREKLALR